MVQGRMVSGKIYHLFTMLNIKKFECNAVCENCYIVSDETKECMIVDCGAHGPFEQKAISQYIEAEGLKPTIHVLTHGHFDHVMGCGFVYDAYGLQPILHERDAETYKNAGKLAMEFGMTIEGNMPAIGRLVNDDEEVTFGNHTFKVIHTPGHSKGSVVYYSAEEALTFTGDTLFLGSIGRTDLPGGSMFQIIQSLRMFTQLPDNTRVLPGHGPETQVGYELAHNPYLDR